MTALLWDQHTCLPLDTDADIEPLTRYQYDGGTLLSVNAGYSPHSFDDAATFTRCSVATSIGWPNMPGAAEHGAGASVHGSSTLLASHRPSTFSIVIFTLLRSSCGAGAAPLLTD